MSTLAEEEAFAVEFPLRFPEALLVLEPVVIPVPALPPELQTWWPVETWRQWSDETSDTDETFDTYATSDTDATSDTGDRVEREPSRGKRYTPGQRQELITRFHQKRQRRNWDKWVVRYPHRKYFAESRERSGGRFIKIPRPAVPPEVPQTELDK